jgi:sialic acid synthase SpsE
MAPDSFFNTSFRIGSRPVGDGAPTFIIAEIGSNHSQDLDTAKRLIDASAKAGASAAKFQSLRYEKVHYDPTYDDAYRKFFAQIELPEAWYPELAVTCRDCGVEFMSSVTYLEAVDRLVEVGAAAIKIASAQFDIFPEVVEKAARTGLPMVMSTGLAELDGVDRMMELVAKAGNRNIALLHCVTAYPAPLETANVTLLNTFRERYGCLTGYSDHTEGDAALLAAIAIGAKVVERHITLDRAAPGPDHHFAIEPDAFAAMVRGIRTVETVLGDGVKPPLNDGERKQREVFFYKPVTNAPIAAGEAITANRLDYRRAIGGIPHMETGRYLGRKASRAIPAGTLLSEQDIAAG